MDADAAWVAGLRRADPDAFDAVYDAYRARLFTFLARLTGDRPLAEDLDAGGLRAPSPARPAISRPTRGSGPISSRSPGTSRSTSDGERASPAPGCGTSRWTRGVADRSPPGPFATPFELTEATETQRRLERALQDLPTPLREAILLVAVEGLSTEAAARVLRVRPAALRKRVSRGRAMLRVALAADDGGQAR